MAWGKEWNNEPIPEVNPPNNKKQVWGKEWNIPQLSEADKEAYEKDLLFHGIAFTKITEDSLKHVPLEKVYTNLHPTHDPYKNPNAHIYYQCACGAILDPGTKSFAELNNQASKQGWKVRWGADSYKPYCVKCGEDVE